MRVWEEEMKMEERRGHLSQLRQGNVKLEGKVTEPDEQGKGHHFQEGRIICEQLRATIQLQERGIRLYQ